MVSPRKHPFVVIDSPHGNAKQKPWKIFKNSNQGFEDPNPISWIDQKQYIIQTLAFDLTNGVLIPKWKIQVIGFGSGWITNNGK